MTMKNNWGVWLDSEIPSAGVISANKVKMEFLENEICLDCEEIFKQIEDLCKDTCPNCGSTTKNFECAECDWDIQDEYDTIECSDHTFIYGDWKKDEDGKYIPDKDGEFSAIYTQGSFNDITVVWSKFTTRGIPCSPCAPSCVSIPDGEEKSGEFLCYTLPDYLLESE